MTLQQIKADIRAGRSPRIYYSANNLWWTHLSKDVEDATRAGREAAEKRHKAFMARTDIPEIEKQKMEGLYKGVANSQTPLDPNGSPLLMTDKVTRWIEVAENKPEHFGKHGLDAFVKAHHQNCNGRCATSWAVYNEMIDDGN